MSKSSQFIARNIVWNKHFSNTLYQEALSLQLNNLFSNFSDRIHYSLFRAEQGSHQQGWHFQGYLEFKKTVDIFAFGRQLAFLWDQSNSFFSDCQLRAGTQQQAIDYIKNPSKPKTFLSDSYEFGFPKLSVHLHNVKDRQIPHRRAEQEIELHHRIRDGEYQKLSDVEKDFEHIFLKQEKWLKNLWDRYHPVEVISDVSAETVWFFGGSGSGKTTETKAFLKSHGLTSFEVCKKKASNSKRPRLWFELEDERKTVLWVEEIRENFPDFNDVIQLIDKGTRLEIKGSHISNNFELIIFNSLFSPEKVYQTLPVSHQIEILRRIYSGKVYYVKRNEPGASSFNTIIDVTHLVPKVLQDHLDQQTSTPFVSDSKPAKQSFLSKLKSKMSSK